MHVNLFYLSDAKFGGFASCTSHLCRSIISMGHTSDIFKVRRCSDNSVRQRPFIDGLCYRNVCVEDAVDICKESPTVIMGHDTYRKDPEPIRQLLAAGSGIVVHDHNEISNNLASDMIKCGTVCIVDRKANVSLMDRYGLKYVLILHPYMPLGVGDREYIYHAVSTARLDWDKKTYWIAEANATLPSDRAIHMFGTHNRSFMFRKMYGHFPGWDDKTHYSGPYYHGAFGCKPGEAHRLYSCAKYAVDMSEIKQDGGGTQYSFLEAIDAGTPLVLNRAWLRNDDTTFIEGQNCFAVGDANELAKFMLSNVDPLEISIMTANASDMLKYHRPECVVPQYINYFADMT